MGNRNGEQVKLSQELDKAREKIAELEEQNKQLKEKTQNHQQIIDQMTSGVALHRIILDKQGKPVDYCFLEVNPAFETITGLKREDIISKRVLEVMPDTEQYWIDTYGKVALTGIPAVLENYSAELDKYFKVTAFSPEKERFVTIFEDVTNSRKAEEIQRDREELLTNLFEASPDSIVFSDLKGTIIFCNKKAARVNGYDSSEALMGRNVFEFFSPGEYEKAEKNMQKTLETGTVELVEYELIRDDGNHYFVELSGAVLKNTDGSPRGFLAITRDVTARKEMELSLQKERDFAEKILNTAIDTIFVYEVNTGKALRWNKAFTEISGYSNEEIAAMKAPDSWYSPEDLKIAVPEIEKILEGEDRRITLNLITRDGSTVPTEYTASLVRNSQGEPDYIIAVGRDITERKKSEEVIKKARDLAENANRTKSVFLAKMSHELRTPLNGIIGFTQLLSKDKEALDTSQFEYVKFIRQSGEHLLMMVNDILDLAKIEEDKVELDKTAVQLAPFFEHAYYTIQLQAKHKKQILDITIPDDIGWLFADAKRIKQVLYNLLSNAVKYTGENKRITLTAAADGNELIITIGDEGIGIPPEWQERIFAPFEQVDSSPVKEEGTGLGLSIAKKIIELHQGTITIESKPGEGTVFTIRLPGRSNSPVSPGTRVNQNGSRCGKGSGVYTSRLLVVDDDMLSRSALSLYLKKINIDHDTAESGEKALELYREKKHDIVLLDIQLPEMGGVELLKKIKKINKNTTVFAITALAMKGDKERFLAEGFDRYYSKPLDFDALFTGVIENYKKKCK